MYWMRYASTKIGQTFSHPQIFPVGGTMLLKRIPGRAYALMALGILLHLSSALPQLSLHAQQQLTITPATMPNGAVGAAYGQALLATGGIPPYHFSISAGALPAGLN